MAPSPNPAFCPFRQPLADLLIAAVRDITELQDAELEALLEGTTLERFDVALDAARSKKDKIKEEYLLHVQEHGCCRGGILSKKEDSSDGFVR